VAPDDGGGHAGVANAYKTLYLTAGADATVVGKDLQQLDFKVVQGAGETRIAAAAGIHPVIVGLSEGLAGSSLNAGNFAAARRPRGGQDDVDELAQLLRLARDARPAARR
jgi:hypothetical protein